ncbi:ABC transporter permease [Pseudemcibacter aquimaris]|uniref:ABC transporter permease n=1 Tax=Pseudemcibacter aquimaris TaxID=2857064 RepID=UPI0020128E13|nr:ABC transporter permease [Pseudemcibacter aquimaris]MCC3861279.1 ABC transporter permease [Pseudemcibacter aquimaris]WDU58053.1 ABC transporter permease [Pseudemcibacter aquimaris]
MLLTNYFVSAWRNIFKHSLFSAINILGLAIGLAACIMIALFVRDELSYDKFWTKADNIYRPNITFTVPGRDPMYMGMTPGPVMNAMKKDFPDIEHATRYSIQEPTIIVDDNYFVDYITLVDPEFTDIFDLEIISGSLDGAMDSYSNIILNETLAQKYFGNTNVAGEILTVDFDNFKKDYNIVAVMKDMRENSHVKPKAIISIDEAAWLDRPYMFDAWFSTNSQLFFSLQNGANIENINKAYPDFVNRNFPKLPFGGDDAETSDMIVMSTMNIQDIHLNALSNGEYHQGGNKNTVMIFATVAILILVIAAINFMNLSTARASQRAKEVSLRKVMGASRKDLIIQFLGESVLMTLFALVIALSIVELALPLYNETIGKELVINYGSSDLLNIVLLAFGVGLLGGAYPAFVLSHFRPAETLKANKSAESDASVKLRYILVVMQFAVSITLFVSTSVVYGQMLYARTMDLGYNTENVLAIKEAGRDVVYEKMLTLVEEIRRMPGVTAVTWSDFMPGNSNNNNTIVHTEGQTVEDGVLIGSRNVGYEYFKTFDIPMIAGRAYSKERGDRNVMTDDLRNGINYTGSIMLNQSALGRLGFTSPEEAIGQIIYKGAGQPEENLTATYEIIGVIPDIHFDSLKTTIRPEVYELENDWGRVIAARFQGDPTLVVEQVRALWEQEIPSIPFDYDFISDAIAKQYSAEQGQATMFAAFSGLAIFIACLGLYGLASFTADRRTKEIGIRKVMGASVFDVVKLLVWQFSKPVIIANLLAWPISYYAMSVWLENFVYRIEIYYVVGFCLLAGISAMLIAWSTVASNSMRVAKANPIFALRYE